MCVGGGGSPGRCVLDRYVFCCDHLYCGFLFIYFLLFILFF